MTDIKYHLNFLLNLDVFAERYTTDDHFLHTPIRDEANYFQNYLYRLLLTPQN